MRRDLNDAFARFRDDEDAWVAIVTGAGRAFCAGADLRGEGASAGDFPGTFWEKPTMNSFESGWEIFKPVIAAVNGYCLGYGLTLVTWCDFVIASERASSASPRCASACRRSSARSGSRSASAGSTRWSSCSPASASTPIGPRRSASPAGSCPTTTSWLEANALADRLLQGAPLAQRAIKEVAMRSEHLSTVEAIRFGETMRKVAGATEDAAEGVQAFRDRRPPSWRGR